jgi:hypothetical protein
MDSRVLLVDLAWTDVAEWDLSVRASSPMSPPALPLLQQCISASRPSPCWPDIAERRATQPLVAAAPLSASMSRRGAVLQASRAPVASSRYPGALRAEVADGPCPRMARLAGRL